MLMTRGPALLFAACVLWLAATAPARAADTSFWRSETFEDFEAGTTEGVSILRDGSIVLSYAFEETAVPDAQYVWTAAAHGGALYAVAGTPGRLYRVRGSEATLLFETETEDITTLAVMPEGRVFVGTAPGGAVYEVRDDGSYELFFATGQGYVWAMAYSREHGLVVGTADSAKVFLVDAGGRGEVIHESTEASVTALASVEGRLLAGTAVGGMLLDVTPGDGVRVLHDSRHDEVTGIARGADGSIYFAAESVLFDEVLNGTDLDASFGEGSVFRTTPSGGVIELWHSPDAPLTCLGVAPDGAVWVGTGSRGRIVSVGPRGRVALVADLEHEQVLSIGSRDGEAIVTTGLAGAILRADAEAARSGTFESDVIDARATATWGELSWRAETPGGSGVRLSTRSGNTEVPDRTWTKWTRVEGKGEGPIASPSSRFLQWRAELTRGSGDTSPVLRAVEVAYLRENLAPVIVGVLVSDASGSYAEVGGLVGEPLSQTLPSGLEVTYSLPHDAPAPRDLPMLTRGLRTAEWEAHDPNGDALLYHVWVRSEDDGVWRVMAEDLRRSAHTWDTQAMPDGRYTLKIVADDSPDNPQGSAGSDERTSAPFVIDNTPPTVADLDASRSGGALEIEGRASDLLSPIVRVEVALDYAEWKGAFASDGIFDSLEERFALTIPELGEGGHIVSVRAIDRSGNVATARRTVR